MFSLLCAVWAWLAESADILLDLAIIGREAHNVFVIATVSGLAIIRLAALLLFTVPAVVWLYRKIVYTEKRGVHEETQVRVVLIVLIIASIAFEIFAVPTHKDGTDTETAVETRIVETERG